MKRRVDLDNLLSLITRIALGVIFTSVLSACRGQQSALDPVGPQASKISTLFWFFFWVMSAIWIAVMLVMIIAIRRGRQKRVIAESQAMQPEVESNPQDERKLTRAVTIASAITVAILFIILILDFWVGRGLTSLAQQDRVFIELTGHQWWWSVRYPDELSSRIVETANEIHIPVGKPVQITLRSHDVNHSFWVPNLHGKKDLIPDMDNSTWLKADKPGIYRGQCAEFCGYQHANMALFIVAEPEDKYNQWLDQQRQSAAIPNTPELIRGQQVFLNAPCVMCHTIRGTSAASRLGPDLTHLASRVSLAAGSIPNTRTHLAGWVTYSQQIKPGNRMPPVPLASEDLQALLSYLESLK